MSTAPHDDEALRRAMCEALQTDASGLAAGSAALQARVLAQWRQRHGQPLGVAQPVLAGGPARRGGGQGARLGLVLGTLVVALALALVWSKRPDPSIDELMQPDVLSQIGLGEL